jgi:hypothetical protein
MGQAVFGIATNSGHAERIVTALKEAGFPSDNVSVLFPDTPKSSALAHELHTKGPEAAAAGAGTGWVVGGVLGWLAGIGSLAIPGIGPFIAAGPVLAAFSGAAVGTAVGGLTGLLIGLGIPEYEAKRYEGRISGGQILVSVHSEDSRETNRAAEILRTGGAEDIASTIESKANDKGKAPHPGLY